MQKAKYDIRIEAEDLSPVKKKLNITVPVNAVKEEFSSAYRSLRSTAAVAGFRKGNVPVNILKARFGDKIREDVTSKLIEMSYPHALHEKKLAPVESPQIDITRTKLDEANEFFYSVTVEVTPDVEIDDYRGMDLRREAVEVTEKDVEEGLKRLQESRAEYKEVERQAKESDLITAGLEGSINGEVIKGSKVDDYPFMIGDKTLLPGLDEALKGVSKGETREAKITFPGSYSDQSLAGKEGVFTLKVKAVKEKVIPPLDDEFAKDLECDNLEALKNRLREDLKKVKEDNEKERVKNSILDKLIEKHPFEVPEALVTRYHGIILNQVAENIKQGSISPEDRGLSSEELKAKYRNAAIRHVKEDVVLDSIAAKEKLEISQEEFDDAIKHLAEARKVPFQSLMNRITQEGATEVIKDGLKHEKVFDIIIEAAKIVK